MYALVLKDDGKHSDLYVLSVLFFMGWEEDPDVVLSNLATNGEAVIFAHPNKHLVNIRQRSLNNSKSIVEDKNHMPNEVRKLL